MVSENNCSITTGNSITNKIIFLIANICRRKESPLIQPPRNKTVVCFSSINTVKTRKVTSADPQQKERPFIQFLLE